MNLYGVCIFIIELNITVKLKKKINEIPLMTFGKFFIN